METTRPAQVPGVTVPEWVLLAAVSDRAVRVYGLLKMEGHPAGEPTTATLADMLHTTDVASVKAAVQELADLGAISITMTVPPGGDA